MSDRNPAEVIRRITGTIETCDGKVTGFSIMTAGMWQQGFVEITSQQDSRKEVLGTRVDMLDAIVNGLSEDSLLERDDDDWDDA